MTYKLIVNKEFENYINCGIFVMAILETFKVKILDWDNWPIVNEANKNPYLKFWLEENKISEEDQQEYYNFNKEIKGKHVLSCPLTSKMPSSYNEAEKKSNELMIYFKGL